MVVYDGPGEGAPTYMPPDTVTWDAVGALGKAGRWISTRDAAIKAVGLAVAKHEGISHALFLDDDCLPYSTLGVSDHCATDAFGRAVEDIIEHGALCGWDRYIAPTTSGRTRGLPYRAHQNKTPWVAHMGLWEEIPDLDAPTQLTGGTVEIGYDRHVLNPYQRIPISGMNLLVDVAHAPWMFFAPMGCALDGTPRPYRRFDDIWMGWLLQKYAEEKRLAITYGPPHVRHVRLSDPFDNLIKEAPGIKANEEIIHWFDDLDLGTLKSSYVPKDSLLRKYLEETYLPGLHEWQEVVA